VPILTAAPLPGVIFGCVHVFVFLLRSLWARRSRIKSGSKINCHRSTVAWRSGGDTVGLKHAFPQNHSKIAVGTIFADSLQKMSQM
jgi:hypothetical protein